METFKTRIRSVRDKATGKSIRIISTEDKNAEMKQRIANLVSGDEIDGWVLFCWGKDLMPSYSFELGSFKTILEMNRHIDRCMNIMVNDSIAVAHDSRW